MMRCIIVEDEQNAREYLERLIERYFNSKALVLASCSSIKDGVDAINKFKPEIVFLDIQMPTERGFKLFEYFENIFFEVIFTTAHKEFAIEAIKHSAHDYLLKPVSQTDLNDTFNRLDIKINMRKGINNLNSILKTYNTDPFKFGKIALPTEKGFVLAE